MPIITGTIAAIAAAKAAAIWVAKTAAAMTAASYAKKGLNAVVGFFKKKTPPQSQPTRDELMLAQQKLNDHAAENTRQLAVFEAKVRKSLQENDHAHQLQMGARREAHEVEMRQKDMDFQWKCLERRENFETELEYVRQKGNMAIEDKRQAGARDHAALTHIMAKELTIFQIAQQAEGRRNELMFTKALNEFPLHLSPMILLENHRDAIYSIEKKLQDAQEQKKSKQKGTQDVPLLKTLSEFGKNPLPIHVFITHLQVDSKVGLGGAFSNLVWDSVIQRVESLFLGEYGRDSERPVLFYPAAWKQDTKPGLHAEETLHYFLKELPCLVIEPRFDGKRLQTIFSGWGVGYKAGARFREELDFAEVNLQAIMSVESFVRSAKSIEQLKDKDLSFNPTLKDACRKWQQNIETYQQLDFADRIENSKKKAENGNANGPTIEDLDSLGEYAHYFHIEKNDIAAVAEQISTAVGTLLGAAVDAHHLLVTAAKPIMPSVCEKYFNSAFSKEYAVEFRKFYTSTYHQLTDVLPEKDLQINLAETLATFPSKNNKDKDEANEKDILRHVKDSLRECLAEQSKKTGGNHLRPSDRLSFEDMLNETLRSANKDDDAYLEPLQHVLHAIGKQAEANSVEEQRKHLLHNDSSF
jgi:hypothetical protein